MAGMKKEKYGIPNRSLQKPMMVTSMTSMAFMSKKNMCTKPLTMPLEEKFWKAM